jgi:outer membrane receptor for ferrienterochelin and colicins
MSHRSVLAVPQAPVLRLILAAFAGACLSSPAVAETAAEGVTTLTPVVITGTRTEKSIDETPIRTEVVTREEIERTHARTLDQALENIPGLQLREIHGKSGYEMSLQGLSSDEVLVLVDGLPLTPSTGSTVDLSQYLLADVERIEVVKGAASAQYGSAAMGGVINIITRVPEPGMRGHISGDLGTFGKQNPTGGRAKPTSRHGQFMVEGGNENWRLRASADMLNDDGFTIDRDSWARQGDEVERKQYGLRADYLPSAWHSYWVDGSIYREDDTQRYLGEGKPPYFARPKVIKDEHIRRNRLSAGGRWTLPNEVDLQLKGLTERYKTDSQAYAEGLLETDRAAKQDTDRISAQVDLPLWRNQLWQFGADYHHESLQQTNKGIAEFTSGKVSRSATELFFQNDIFLGERWEMLVGARWQNDSDFGNHFAPKVSLRFDALRSDDWTGTLRASFGQGYRVPNLKERHYLFDHSVYGYMVLGNPDLKPESSNSFQFGGTLNYRESVTFEANLFHNRVKDLIQTDLDNAKVINGLDVYTYDNVSRARTQGIETNLRWQALSSLGMNFGYTFTDAKNLDTGSRLTRRPRHMGRVGVDWQALQGTKVTVRAKYQSNELVSSRDANYGGQTTASSDGVSPSWTTVDLAVDQTINSQLTAFVGVNNVFDKQRDFADPSDFGPIRGRFVYLGARYSFGKP